MRIIYAGTPEFAVPSLRQLLLTSHDVCAVYTQPDRPAGRGRKLHPSPVKELAASKNTPVFQPVNLKSEEDIDQIRSLEPDLIIVVAYGMILPQSVLDIPPLGCINVHGSLLPRWRGAAPIQRAIIAGDKKTGITIMQIIQKLDAGDMLHKEEYDIKAHDTAGELHDKLAELGAIGLEKVIRQLETGTIITEKQDENLVTYAEKLTKLEANLDWSKPAEELDRIVRGLNPWPVAQTSYRGQALRIWRAEPIAENANLPPGTATVSNNNLAVATGDGFLRLIEIQLPGGKRIPSQAFLQANPIDGIKLG